MSGRSAIELQIDVIRSAELPPSLHDEIVGWLVATFIEDDDDTVWASVDWHVLGWVDGELVGHVDLLRRELRVGASRITVAGIGGVVTKRRWRGKGLGRRLMRGAQRLMREEMDIDFRLLMCDEAMIPFYESLGWRLVAGPLAYDQPTRQELFDDAVMVHPIRGDAFPEGEIDIHGYPWWAADMVKITVGEGIAKEGTLAAGFPASLFDADGRRMLLVRRADSGCWAVPGGYVEPRESWRRPASARCSRKLA